MNTYIAKLEFASALTFRWPDMRAEGRAVLRSDTLFSALCHAWASLYGPASLEELLSAPDGRPGVLVSSLYVFTPDTYYLPKPLARPPHEPDPALSRRLQKVAWLPLPVFRSWVQDRPVDWPRVLAEEPLGYARTHAAVWRARVASDRRLNRIGPFRERVVVFRSGCGGYAILQTESDETANRLSRCLVLLGETGIGGRRSLGRGQFAVATGGLIPAPTEWDFLKRSDANAGVVLSLYAPTPEEAPRVAAQGAYSLCVRGGWAHGATPRPPAKKAQCTLVEEGSVVPLPCRGQVLDVTPQAWRGDGHRVFRSAAPVVAPCRRAGGGA